MVDERHSEHTDFPRAGYRARRWNRFERDLYEWMNRPEGQFHCWLAGRKLDPERVPVGAAAAGKRAAEAGSPVAPSA